MSRTVLKNDKTAQNDTPAVVMQTTSRFIAGPTYPNALLDRVLRASR